MAGILRRRKHFGNRALKTDYHEIATLFRESSRERIVALTRYIGKQIRMLGKLVCRSDLYIGTSNAHRGKIVVATSISERP